MDDSRAHIPFVCGVASDREGDVNQVIDRLLQATVVVWMALVVVWVVGALRTKRTIQSQSGASQLLYTAILVIGVYLIFTKQSGIPWLDRQLFPPTFPIVFVGLLGVLTGVAFSIWARLMLGGNWSNRVTVKEDHTLVRTGPYRIVRHPIYSGILLGMLGSALQRGRIRCFFGALICGFSFWLKTRVEERFMVQSFGEQYLQYRHRVKALAPFIF
jgi:protein-S-isoprenylcysteine O-methyltransferase Ste14